MISENRSLIFELSPPVLKEAGLTPAIEELAEKILSPQKIQWHIISKGSTELTVDASICVILYRRDCTINCVKGKRTGGQYNGTVNTEKNAH